VRAENLALSHCLPARAWRTRPVFPNAFWPRRDRQKGPRRLPCGVAPEFRITLKSQGFGPFAGQRVPNGLPPVGVHSYARPQNSPAAF